MNVLCITQGLAHMNIIVPWEVGHKLHYFYKCWNFHELTFSQKKHGSLFFKGNWRIILENFIFRKGIFKFNNLSGRQYVQADILQLALYYCTYGWYAWELHILCILKITNMNPQHVILGMHTLYVYSTPPSNTHIRNSWKWIFWVAQSPWSGVFPK
jgi:hypothetical protein